MNLDEIKKRLDKLNNKGGGGSSDFKNNFWRPPVGEKSVVRIVPYAHNKDFPFSELYFYFGIGKPRMIALSNFSEADPIMITDIQNGSDVTIEVIPAAETGKMFNTTTVRVKPNQTPLVKDAAQAESLLENQKDLVSLFKKYTFEEMKDELQGWLKPSEEDGGKETEVKAAPSKGKKDLDSKLDELFD